jgi:hypothetical protein
MKYLKLLLALVVIVACTAALALGVDVVPVAAAPAPSILDWFMVNKAAVFGAALAFSELLSLIPSFKGNGILDTIIKALVQLSGKPPQVQ